MSSAFRVQKLSVCDAASHLGLSVSLLNKLRVTGGGPTYLKLGRRVLYNISDLETWADQRRRASTAA